MRSFVLRRLFAMVLVWIGVVVLTFIIANVVPRDPVAIRLGLKGTPETIALMRHQLGLDQPLPVQFAKYVGDLLHGNLGTSIWSQRPVAQDLADYLPPTIELTVVSLAITVLVGVPLGAIAAARKGSVLDRVVGGIATVSVAAPSFWLGAVGQIVFYRELGWLPLEGRIDTVLGPPAHVTGLFVVDSLLSGDVPRLLSSLSHLVLPSIALSLWSTAAIFRQVRASTLATLSADYVRTARAKGLAGGTVLRRHVLRNSLLPVVTVFGSITTGLLGGAFVIEVVFNWRGIGWYGTQSILAADYKAIMGITLVIAVIVTVGNLVTDLAYGLIDPRIRYS